MVYQQCGDTIVELFSDPDSVSDGKLHAIVNSDRCVLLVVTSDDNCANKVS